MQNSVKKQHCSNVGFCNADRRNEKADALGIIESKMSDGKKYFEYAKKTGAGKYYVYALVNYRAADELLEKMRFDRLKKKNNDGVDDLKSGKYDFLVIAKNIASAPDKKFIEAIEKEIGYVNEIKEQEKSILHEIEIFFEKKEKAEEEKKYDLLLRSEIKHSA
ncbi:MAG: hypothetical protein M1331_03235 [Candidatus Marsarchaeota archaeon]|nr:hypothetical protein [Candidatus Marsarchaeota archaeon]MCL5106380.1 hypothetical protein [Candidatus Marsarchaeota archaeon]